LLTGGKHEESHESGKRNFAGGICSRRTYMEGKGNIVTWGDPRISVRGGKTSKVRKDGYPLKV